MSDAPKYLASLELKKQVLNRKTIKKMLGHSLSLNKSRYDYVRARFD
jgi:hypothetical protein